MASLSLRIFTKSPLAGHTMRRNSHFALRSSPLLTAMRMLSTQSTNPSHAVPMEEVKSTGAFMTAWPVVHTGPTHFKRAWRQTKAITLNKTIKNVRNAQRAHSAQWIDALMKGLTVPITEVLNLYKRKFHDLHPFEATVAKLTIAARTKAGLPDLETLLMDMKSLRATTSRLAKDYACKANNASTALDAKEIMKEAQQALEALYLHSPDVKVLDEMMHLHQSLRSIPVLSLSLPSVALVGMPNVGKSSLVRALSSGMPEINNYPFTTRGVSIGHIYDTVLLDDSDSALEGAALGMRTVTQTTDPSDAEEVEMQQVHYQVPKKTMGTKRRRRFQVMDTPGLLDRPYEERNEMEQLTFASLLHLPTAVIFVLDITNSAGEQSTIDKQLNVRNALRERFPKRPWIDVISKGDTVADHPNFTDKDLQELLPKDALVVSVKTGENIPELQARVQSMLEYLEKFLMNR